MKKSIWILSVILSACSQTTPVQQIQQPVVFHTTLDTINFGKDPLWREADTTITINLASNEPITSIVIADSNFSLLDTSQRNDTLRISLRFQAQSLGNHSSNCLVFSKQDTLAKLTLLGETSPFERHIGDSYVFLDSLNTIDSIWISALPLTFSTRDSEDADLLFRSAVLKQKGDWIVQPQPVPLYPAGDSHGMLPVTSLAPSDVGWQGTFDTDYHYPTQGKYESYTLHSDAGLIALPELIAGYWFNETRITMSDAYFIKARFVDFNISGTFSGNYSTIGFFVSYSYSGSEQGYNGPYISQSSHNSYRLLRFHLRR
jgi:hypothetical protein